MSRIEAAVKAWDHHWGDRYGDEALEEMGDEVKVALDAADSHDAAHGIHRVKSDWATLGRVSDALYAHREGALTCYDHSKAGRWCCVCGEHEITEIWRDHAARAVLAAAVEAGQ